ncbi:MAG: hypothetical protein JWN76_426 [Chitinophagaceae bacterium]|nr:hypothetical protein [Chitinophagaceae bacterium]
MNNHISLQQAIAMTTRYRENKTSILAPGVSMDILCISETFPKLAVTGLLAQEGAEFLRIYYGMDEQLDVHAIVVAADKDGKDMLTSAGLTGTADDPILEEASRCPPLCPAVPSPLNP